MQYYFGNKFILYLFMFPNIFLIDQSETFAIVAFLHRVLFEPYASTGSIHVPLWCKYAYRAKDEEIDKLMENVIKEKNEFFFDIFDT